MGQNTMWRQALCLLAALAAPLWAAEIPLPRATVPRLQPVIDGKLDPAEWQGASTIVGLWGMKAELAALRRDGSQAGLALVRPRGAQRHIVEQRNGRPHSLGNTA
jgi:hypothetical protein